MVVSGSFYCVEDGKISGRAAIKIYHFFQQVIDEVSEDVSAVMISLRQEEQNIVCTMNVEADLCPVEAVKRCGAECEEDYDGSWLLSLTYREEVESCNFKNDIKLNCFKTVCHNGSSCKSSDKRM